MGLRILVQAVIATIILLPATRVRGGNRYCYSSDHVNQFQLAEDLKFSEERIIPETDGYPVPKGGLNCRWKILNEHLDGLLVVLSGFDVKRLDSKRRWIRSAGASQRMRYELHSQPSSSIGRSTKATHDVKQDMLRVLHLPRGSFLTVFFRLSQAISVSLGVPGLRIQLMEPGFCGPDIVNFKGSCYMSSSVHRSLTDELAAISKSSTLIRLASFRSYGELLNFVKESQRTRVGLGLGTRSKKPLNLVQNLRIGIFYEHKMNKILYLNGSGDKCKVAEFEDAEMLNYTLPNKNSSVSCGSIKGTKTPDGTWTLAQVDFLDCNETLPALISFPDEARNKCKNCTFAALSLIQAINETRKRSRNQNNQSHSSDAKSADSIPLIALLICASVVLLVLIVLLIAIIRWKKSRQKRLSSSSSKPLADNFIRLDVSPAQTTPLV